MLFLPWPLIIFVPQLKESIFPGAVWVQLDECIVSDAITLCKLSDVFVNAGDNSTGSHVRVLTLACNLGPMIDEEGVLNLTGTAKFDQRVLELGEAQLSLIFGNLV
jgi:hypothetical protein